MRRLENEKKKKKGGRGIKEIEKGGREEEKRPFQPMSRLVPRSILLLRGVLDAR